MSAISENKRMEFGWVQNPNNFIKLKNTVSILDSGSKYNQHLVNNFNQFSRYTRSHKDHWQAIWNGITNNPVTLRVSQLIGRPVYSDDYTGKKQRKAQAPYGLVQVSAGKGKDFSLSDSTDDWTSRGYVNWALTLDFWELDYSENPDDPLVKLTKSGKDFAESPDDPYINKPKKRHQISIMEMILRKAMISYPPAVRILEILNAHPNQLVSKFQLGGELGFVGEPGFTSFNEKTWINQLISRPLPKTTTAKWLKDHNFSNPDRTKFRSNAEGSADKWARSIASWLYKLKLVDQKRKNIPNVSNKYKGVYISQSYKIKSAGVASLKRAHGYSKHHPQKKYISWQMLATKVQNANYVRIRRGYTIKGMQKYNDLKDIAIYLEHHNLFISYPVLKNDIFDLHCFGLYFTTKPDTNPSKYKITFKDNINDFPIPKRQQPLSHPKLYKRINQYERKLTNLKASDFQLIELAQHKAKTRARNTVAATIFENRVVNFMKDSMRLNGTHLGGPRKPDGALYYKNKFGIILDTKQYSKGYDLPINQQREMIDYIRNDQHKDSDRLWWKNFPSNLSSKDTYYLWVACKFTGQYQKGLNYTHQQTGMNGAAMPILSLLIIGNNIKGNPNKVFNVPKLMHNKAITTSQATNI